MSRPERLKNAGEAVFQDSGITKFGQIIQTADENSEVHFGLVGLPLSKPSISHSGASMAPGVMRSLLRNTATYAIEEALDLKDVPIHDLGDVEMHVTDLKASHQYIEETLYSLYQIYPDMVPLILGGDHSVSCPSIKAFGKAKGTVGIIQFDAHHDLRNLDDGGPSNGTPFRGLIESGAINPEHLVQIGLRNFSNSLIYHQYALEQGITVKTMKDVRKKGLLTLVKDAYEQLVSQVDCIYLSVDIDVIDQAFAPGCPAIGPGGVYPDDLFEAIQFLSQQALTQAIDIVEIDPTQDYRDMTSKIGVYSILSFLIGKKKSKANKEG